MSTPAVSIEVSNSNAYIFTNASNQDVVLYPTSESMRINIGTKSNVNSAVMIGSSNITFTVQPTNNTGSFTFADGTNTTIMNLLANGNLGVGTPTPGYRLDVGGDINFTGTFRQNGNPYIGSQWSNNSSNVFINGSNIGIGTSTPARLLHVAGDVRFDSNIFVNGAEMIFPSTSNSFLAAPTNGINGGNGERIILFPGDVTNTPYSIGMSNLTLWYSVPNNANHQWFVNSTAIMSLTANLLTCTQDIAAFGSISDIKFKTNVESFVSASALEDVMLLKPVSFKWKTDLFNDTYAGKDDVGFIAQEVESVIPLAVKNTKHGDMEEFKTIKYERLLPYLVGAIQELKRRVEDLEQEKASWQQK